jgi:hypothetical protein
MQDNINKCLEDWITNFLKNKDIIKREIQNIEKQEGKIIITYTTKKQICLIVPFIENFGFILKEISNKEYYFSLIVFNTQENFDIIVSNWNKLTDKPKLSIYFVNPFSKTDKKWIIFPCTHNLISDKSALKVGLLSLFNTVEVLTEEEVRKILSK